MTREVLLQGLKLAKEQYLDLTLVKPEDIASIDTLEELMEYLYDADEDAQYIDEYDMC